MKWKAFVSLCITMLLLLTTIGAATADISFLTTDGVWGAIDGGGGASGDRWATGPTGNSPIGTSGLVTSDTNPAIQSPPTNDWNQVRYGTEWWGEAFGGVLDWEDQSGLAFRGVANSGDPYSVSDAFLVGKFCHVNHPISASNALENVPLTLTMNNLSCGITAVAPFPPTTLSFIYPVNLDETSNSGTCTYPSDPGNPCSDAVAFSQTDTNIVCNYPGSVVNTYTVSLLGFKPVSETTDCKDVVYNPDDPNDKLDGIFISQEGATNCGCLFAMITEGVVNAVNLYSFEGVGSAAGVTLSWETADETDNLGFNVYRADSLVAEKVQLNTSLLPTNVPPGSPFGALYSFEDPTAEEFQTYFYWLEDVDVNGTTTLHGPVMVEK